MKIAGMIAEYNPFHNGHAWHIAETRRAIGGESGILCVMSGHWTQGGDCAIFDKWTRATFALEGGADLVLELPTVWAASSAEHFARGAVETLAACGVVDFLSFGSECGTLEDLRDAATCLDSEGYPAALKGFLREGMSFPAARAAAVRDRIGAAGECLSHPNNNLGVEYLRALMRMSARIEPMTIKRHGCTHHAAGEDAAFLPATALRKMLREGTPDEVAPFVRDATELRLRKETCADLRHVERAMLARLRGMSAADFAALPDGGVAEGLPERLRRCARQACGVAEFLAHAKTKRYPHARLRRLLLWAFLGLTAENRPPHPLYLRVLGSNARGHEILRRMKGTATLPVLTKPAHVKNLGQEAQALFRCEARATDLYALCFPNPRPCGLEWHSSPVDAAEDLG
ncbi:MAG: nucleotidyltransferase family protein [Oscillospiraceae bacterium]|nr:nucleotidyltransferase family protein [Oscillospiraceae bacterium]